MKKDKEPQKQDQEGETGIKLTEAQLKQKDILRRAERLKEIIEELGDAQSPRKIQKILNIVIDL